MKLKGVVLLIFCIVISELAGIIGSIFTFNAIPTWYATLNKPAFSPPNWLFGPVWTTLYLLMGISLFLVLRKGFKKKGVRAASIIFGIQLMLNALWSIIFFGLGNIGFAFFWILLLWFFILLTMIEFYRISKPASFLLLPYILWVSFASALNFAVWMLN